MNKSFKRKLKSGFLLFTGIFIAFTASLNPFQSDQAKELAGYFTLLILLGSLAIIVEMVVLTHRASRSAKHQ